MSTPTASVSACTVDITPTEPLELFGFADRYGTFSRIRSRLEANILHIHDPGGRDFFLVATDSLYGGELRTHLIRALEVDDDQLLVCGSHTHFAPGVDSQLPRLGATSPDYVAASARRIAEAIRQANQRPDASIGWAVGTAADLFMNRRRPTFGIGVRLPHVNRVLSAPHQRGPVDSRVRCAVLSSGDTPVAVLWSVACHPVCSPGYDCVSADFPGEVRDGIRLEFGADLPVLFLQGFSGDVRPSSVSRRPPHKARELVSYVVAGGTRFVDPNEREFKSWCDRLRRDVVSTVTRAMHDRAPVEVTVKRIAASTPPGWRQRIPRVHVAALSRGLSLVGVNAEVVNERVRDVEAAAADDEFIITIGCCDEVIGYWPTDAMEAWGGYEACGSRRFFPPLDWDALGGRDAPWQDLVQQVRVR